MEDRAVAATASSSCLLSLTAATWVLRRRRLQRHSHRGRCLCSIFTETRSKKPRWISATCGSAQSFRTCYTRHRERGERATEPGRPPYDRWCALPTCANFTIVCEPFIACQPLLAPASTWQLLPAPASPAAAFRLYYSEPAAASPVAAWRRCSCTTPWPPTQVAHGIKAKRYCFMSPSGSPLATVLACAAMVPEATGIAWQPRQ